MNFFPYLVPKEDSYFRSILFVFHFLEWVGHRGTPLTSTFFLFLSFVDFFTSVTQQVKRKTNKGIDPGAFRLRNFNFEISGERNKSWKKMTCAMKAN